VPNIETYWLEEKLGYLLTVADKDRASAKLEEYIKLQDGNPD
jgi:hypothetical protein